MEKPSNIPEAPNINSTTENSKTIQYIIDIEKKLKISFNDTIISFTVIQSFLPQKEYEVNLSLEQLCKINRFFINFKNQNYLIDWILNSLKHKNSNIEFKDNKCFIQMLNPMSNKTIELILNVKENRFKLKSKYFRSNYNRTK